MNDQPAVLASNLPGHHAVEGCRKCGCATGYLARYVKADRSISIRWVCEHCEDYGTAGDLPHSVLSGTQLVIHDLPKRVDRGHESGPECVICSDGPAHVHHWAPVTIFPHWPQLIGVYLCERHHKEWHTRMRVHGLRWPHELGS